MQVLTVVYFTSLCFLCVTADSVVVPLPEGPTTNSTTDVHENGHHDNATVAKPDVYKFRVYSDIRFRFAHTLVSSRIANPANVAQEVSFTAVLPETAFISGFLMEIDGQVYNAYVKEKEAAQQEYSEAVRHGQTAAHVALSARDSNRFTVSVNIEPQKKVTFNLTYDELLNRKLGTYKHVINLDPGQIVKDFSVEVQIDESSDITALQVPALRTSNEIEADPSTGANNPLAIIERPTPHSAIVKFAPTPEQQRDLASDGIKGQLIVQYDVDRTSHPGEVLVNNGYFVHFFAPPDLPPLPKQVTFVLDVSGSMQGRKIEQLRQAMAIILDDLKPSDFFSIILFSSTVQVWRTDLSENAMRESLLGLGIYPWGEQVGGQEHGTLPPTVIGRATPENIAKAKAFVQELRSVGATNIYGALMKALEVSSLEHNHAHTSSAENDIPVLQEGNQQKPEPLIIFLTDGQPNVGTSDTNVIVFNVTSANTRNSSIFTLALGDDADLGFLKKLSLRNSGFARKIYEASDTALQLRDFYRQVASPLLANVTFRYQPDQVDEGTLTKRTFRRLFGGAELVVAGKLLEDNVTSEVQGLTSSGSTIYPFIPHCIIIPPPPLPENNTNTTFSSMERLWAYLTIQQLLEEHEAKDYSHDGNQSSPEKQHALELALKYSFVTPLTSLVVVKPNETRSVDTEDASHSTPDFDRAVLRTLAYAGQPILQVTGPNAPLYSPAGLAGPSGLPGAYYPQAAALPQGLSRPYPASLPGSPGIAFAPGVSGNAFVPGPPGIPFVPGAPGIALSPDASGSLIPGPVVPPPSYTPVLLPQSSLANLSDVTWISENDTTITFTTVNGTDEVLQLASDNETDVTHGECITPWHEPGYCRHFRFCVLVILTVNKPQYTQTEYLCRIDGFAGVCCPQYIHANNTVPLPP